MSKQLEELFTTAAKGYNLKALYNFKQPALDIQPAVVPSNFKWTQDVIDGEISKDGLVLSNSQLKSIKTYIKETRETGNVGKELNVEKNENGKIVDLTPNALLSKNAEFVINPLLKDAVNEAYDTYVANRGSTKMGDAPLYIVVFGKVAGGHASIFFY
ncbi:MAG: hypothetical protein EBU82_11285, partial [Flavobacteriia bacterium]|nr:hypothetical protein [Flavobacteriia bacterium]